MCAFIGSTHGDEVAAPSPVPQPSPVASGPQPQGGPPSSPPPSIPPPQSNDAAAPSNIPNIPNQPQPSALPTPTAEPAVPATPIVPQNPTAPSNEPMPQSATPVPEIPANVLSKDELAQETLNALNASGFWGLKQFLKEYERKCKHRAEELLNKELGAGNHPEISQELKQFWKINANEQFKVASAAIRKSNGNPDEHTAIANKQAEFAHGLCEEMHKRAEADIATKKPKSV